MRKARPMKSQRGKELRCYFAELIGTFAIVLFGCGSVMVLPVTDGKHLSVNVVFGLIVAAMIYSFGHISGAHFNPAVTLGSAAVGRFPWRCAVGYWVSQFAGAFLASVCLWAIGNGRSFGATLPSISLSGAVLVEALMTFFLMLVIVATATDKRACNGWAGAAIGATVLICGIVAGPLTGNSLNPARSLGPSLFQAEALKYLWVYFAGPCLGAVAAALTYKWLAGSHQRECVAGTCC